jgi:hypothetical protein
MDYYLIDYENTGENGLKGITELPEDSCVVIFYSENADKISFDMHQKFCICKTKLEFRKINTGRKNALDFQLSTYLGYLIAKSEEDRYYIVSKDNGYRSVVDFWRDKKVRQIDFIARITGKPLLITTTKEADSEQEEAEEELAVQEEILETESVEPEIPETDTEKPEAFKSEPEEPENLASEPEEPETMEPETIEPENAEPETVNAEIPEPETARTEVPEPEIAEKTDIQDEVPFEEILPDPGQKPVSQDTQEEEKKTKKSSRQRQSRKKKDSAAVIQQPDELQPTEELRASVAEVIEDAEAVEHICRFIVKYKTKQGVNNAIVKIYGTEKAGELYKKIKPLLKDKKGK